MVSLMMSVIVMSIVFVVCWSYGVGMMMRLLCVMCCSVLVRILCSIDSVMMIVSFIDSYVVLN